MPRAPQTWKTIRVVEARWKFLNRLARKERKSIAEVVADILDQFQYRDGRPGE